MDELWANIREPLLPPQLPKRKSDVFDLDPVRKQILEKLGSGAGIIVALCVDNFPNFHPNDVRLVSLSAYIWREGTTFMYMILTYHPNRAPEKRIAYDVPKDDLPRRHPGSAAKRAI